MEYYPCKNKENCPQKEFKRGCYEDVHHKYYPRNNYRTSIEKEFRELESNKELSCRQRHNDIHAMESPPMKPTHIEMLTALGKLTVGEETAA